MTSFATLKTSYDKAIIAIKELAEAFGHNVGKIVSHVKVPDVFIVLAFVVDIPIRRRDLWWKGICTGSIGGIATVTKNYPSAPW